MRRNVVLGYSAADHSHSTFSSPDYGQRLKSILKDKMIAYE